MSEDEKKEFVGSDIGDCEASGAEHDFKVVKGPKGVPHSYCGYCGCTALDLYERAFEALFEQALSNGLFDAWGRRINAKLLNDAHYLAQLERKV